MMFRTANARTTTAIAPIKTQTTCNSGIPATSIACRVVSGSRENHLTNQSAIVNSQEDGPFPVVIENTPGCNRGQAPFLRRAAHPSPHYVAARASLHFAGYNLRVTGAIQESSRAISSESALLLACARTRLDSPTVQRIQSIVEDGAIDWALLVRRSLAHGLTPLLARNLLRACGESLPPDLADALRDSLHANRERNVALAGEVCSIVELLATGSIPVLPIKGPVLAKTLYDDLALRPSGDLDFLVRPRDVSAALNLLLASGYQLVQSLSPSQDAAYRRYYPDFGLTSPDQNVSVELHWNPVPHVMAVSFDIDALWRHSTPIAFEGRQVLSLSPEDYLVYLCVHGGKHLWSRLTWICDIHRFVAVHAAIDWNRCIRTAKDLGCERMLRVGLDVARTLLETQLPEQAQAYIREDPRATVIARQIQARFLAGDDRQTNVFHAFRPFLPLRERFRDKALYCWRNVTTPRVNHFGIVQLPRALWFLYVPIKLLYDYGWRPLTGFRRRGPE